MSDVLDYVRSKDARFAEVPDQDLTLYLGQKAPEFLADPEFKAQFTQFAAEKANAIYKQATGFNQPGFDPYAGQRSSLGGVNPGAETVTGAPAEPVPKPQLSTEQEAAGATLDMIPITSVPGQFKGDVMAWQNRNLPIPDSMKAPAPDPHKVLSGLVEDWAGAVAHNFTEPLVNPDEVYPFSKEDRELIKLLPWPFKASDAVLYKTAQMISGFTSASGANELMAASLSGPIGTAGKLYFAIEGAKAAPQALSNLMDEAAKPPEQRDAGNIAGNLFDLGMSGLMVTGGLHGGLELAKPKPEVPLTPEQQQFAARSARAGATAAGNEMVYQAIAKRVGIGPEVTEPMSAQRPQIEQRMEQERTQAEADRQAELQRGIGQIEQIKTREPASVPETAPEAERELTVLQEIRQAGARTKKQIQRLFPQRGLSNQEAARLRDAAWGAATLEAPAGSVSPEPAQPALETKANEAKPGAVESPAPGGPGHSWSAAEEEELAKAWSEAPTGPNGEDILAPKYQAMFRVKRAKSMVRQLGPWSEQKTAEARARWQQAKAELDAAWSQFEQLRGKTAVPAEAATPEPEATVPNVGDKDPGTRRKYSQGDISAIRNFNRQATENRLHRFGDWVITREPGDETPHIFKFDREGNHWVPKAIYSSEAWTEYTGQPAPALARVAKAKGGPFQASTPVEGQPIKGNWDIVEEGDLKTSFDAGYDPKLQPRDRSRQASANQIAEIVRRFQPARLGNSLTSDLGAPFVDEKGQVTSGNGRVTAIRALYDAGQGGTYKDWLVHNAKEFGLAPEGIGVMDRPVLVRRVSDYGDLTKEQFAEQSNRQQVLGKSEAEKAASDAKMLESNPKLLESFAPDEEGNVLAAGNRPFLNAFIQGTGDQAELLTKDGYNGPALIKRVKNAVLGALIGPEDRTLLNQLIEGADELNLRHAVNGTMSAAPGLMRFKGTAYDLSPALAQALKDLVSLRTTGEKLHDFLTGKPLFTDPNRTAQSDALLQSLAEAGSAKRIAEPLATYIRGAGEALQDAQAGGMFGTRPATREQIISRIYGERNGQTKTTEPVGKPEESGGAGGPAPGPENPAAPGQPKIFTNDAAEAAKQRLRNKLKGTNIFVDPTLLADVVIMAGNVIERGAIKYADYVKEMLKELGEEFRPYFKAAYNQVREYTEAARLKRLMSPRQEIEDYENANQPGGGATGGTGPDHPAGAVGGGPELAGAVRGGGGGGRPGVRVVDEGDIPAARPIVRAGQYKGPTGEAIDETQRLAINLALTRFEDGGDAFLLGDGTGVGKTGTELGIAVETAKRTGKPTLIVTQNRSIIENQFKAQAEKFGVPTDKIHFATYDDLSRGNVPAPAGGGKWGLVIFDEAHNLKNAGSARNFRSQLIEADHRIFATATPMDSPTHAAYFLAQITGKTREQVASMLGYKFVTRTIGGQEREFVELEKGNSWAKVIDHIKELRNKAVANGTLIRREYPFYGQANFRNMADLDGIQKEEQDRIIDYWDKRIEKVRSPTAKRNLAGQKTLELSRWLEAQKIGPVLNAVLDDLKNKRKVVVFAEGYNDTLIKGLERTVPGFLSSLAKHLDTAGIKYLKLFEDSAAKKSRAAADFQKGKADVILATPRSGGAGIDLDDMVGNAPRTVHFVTMNFSGDVFDQMLGRVSRRNTASPAQAVIWRARDAFADQRRQQVLDRKLMVLRNIQAGEDLDVSDFVRQADSEGGGAPSSMWTEYGDGNQLLREGPPIGNPEHWHLSDDELQGRIADLEGQMELDASQQHELENLYLEAEQRGIDTGRGLPEAGSDETHGGQTQFVQGRQPAGEPAGGSQPDLRGELQARPAAAQGAELPVQRTAATPPKAKTPGAEAKRLARAAARARREALRAKRGQPAEQRPPAQSPNWPQHEEGPLSAAQRYTIASHFLQRAWEIEPTIEKLTGQMAPREVREPGVQGGKNMASANELAYWQAYHFELREAAAILSQPGYEAALNQMVQNHNARLAEFKQGKVAPHRAQPELARGLDGEGDALRLIANLLEKPPGEMPQAGPELPLQVPHNETPKVKRDRTAPAPALRSATPAPAMGPGEQMQLLEKGTPYRASASEAAELRRREEQQVAEHLPTGAKELKASAGSPSGTSDAALPPTKWFKGLRSFFAPQTLDEGAMTMAGIIRSALGKEYAAARRADAALRPFRREFDRTPVGRNWTYEPGRPLPRNYEVMRAIDTGDTSRLTTSERTFATVMRRLFDEAIAVVQEVSPGSLRELIENYFPRIWRQKSALDRSRLAQLLSQHPWEGPKSFLKKRVLQYFTNGLEKGLRPVSDNPVDVTMAKLGEMYRFAATRRALKEAKDAGLRRFVYIYERPPEGWREVDDPSSSVYKPPTVTIQEAFDAQVRAKTLELLQSLGVPHERLAKIGGRRWGYAEPGTGKIVTKFGGPDFVIWHELGHQMDWRYPELRKLLGEGKLAKELRDLADLRAEGEPASAGYRKYLHKIEEKIANVFDAYIRAPEKFKRTAPGVYEAFDKWLDQHPELGPKVREIRPSLTLKAGKTNMFIGGPVLLGRWMMPEGAAQVADNYLKPGLGKFATVRSLREASGLVNGLQLLGFFHGQFVMNDSFYSGIGLALYDVMTGHPARALKEVAQIPVSPFTSLYRGYKINQAIAKPQEANAHYRQLGQLAVEQNLRAGHGNYDPQFARRWVRAIHETIHEPSAGAAWESLWRAPLAGLETAMKPVMSFLVPHMKQGIMARMSERVLADNPNADTATLRRKLAEAADATEDRLGQVTYDNLFQNRVLKDIAQLAFRAYGWQLTKYRMILGGTGDWVRAGAALAQGQKPTVTFRMAYLPAMVMGHALIGSVLQYMLTGKGPQEAKDYLFPKSGLTDAYGQPVRIAIADFVKDVVADWRAFPNLNKLGAEWSRKLAPFWNMAAEMYRNEDFWGTRIFSPKEIGEPALQHFFKSLAEGAAYMANTAQPFSVRAAGKFAQAGGGKLGVAAPFLGFVPAPRYATQTPAETRAGEIIRELSPQGGRTRGQAEHSQQISELVRDLRSGKINSAGELEQRARAAGVKDKAELTRIQERVLWTPLQYQVAKMPLVQAMEVFDLANDQERLSLAKGLATKIQHAFDGGRLEAVTARRYVQLVMPYYKQALRGPPAPAPARGAGTQRGAPVLQQDVELLRQRSKPHFFPADFSTLILPKRALKTV